MSPYLENNRSNEVPSSPLHESRSTVISNRYTPQPRFFDMLNSFLLQQRLLAKITEFKVHINQKDEVRAESLASAEMTYPLVSVDIQIPGFNGPAISLDVLNNKEQVRKRIMDLLSLCPEENLGVTIRIKNLNGSTKDAVQAVSKIFPKRK